MIYPVVAASASRSAKKVSRMMLIGPTGHPLTLTAPSKSRLLFSWLCAANAIPVSPRSCRGRHRGRGSWARLL